MKINSYCIHLSKNSYLFQICTVKSDKIKNETVVKTVCLPHSKLYPSLVHHVQHKRE